MRRTITAILLALALLGAPLALAQGDGTPQPEADNDTQGAEDRLVDEESTIEDDEGIAFYVVVAVLSVGVFIGLAVLNARYRRQRGSRPPP